MLSQERKTAVVNLLTRSASFKSMLEDNPDFADAFEDGEFTRADFDSFVGECERSLRFLAGSTEEDFRSLANFIEATPPGESVTDTERLTYACYRIDEAMTHLFGFEGEGWASAHHTLDKARFVLDIGPMTDRKDEIKDIERRIIQGRKTP